MILFSHIKFFFFFTFLVVALEFQNTLQLIQVHFQMTQYSV